MPISRKELRKLKSVTEEDDKRLIKEGKKEYDAQKYLVNKEKMLEQSCQWRKNNKEKVVVQQHQYYEENKEEIKEQQKQYKSEHREERKEYMQGFMQNWWQTEAGKASIKKSNYKRRGLGFLELNEHFEGAEAHHIDEDTIVYTPKELHCSIPHNVFTGKGMVEINNKVTEWLIDIGELMPLSR